MNIQLNELQRLLAEIDSLMGSVEVTGLIRDARSCAINARSVTAKAIKIVAKLDAQQPSPAPELERPGRKLGMTALINEAKVLMAERAAAQARVAELYRQVHVARVDFSEPWSIAWNDRANPPANGTRLYAAPVAQAGQVPEWIACTDRLPTEEESQFLILLEDGSICVSDYLCDLDAGWFFQKGAATHWLPLPYAPAQGGE